jgi:hypothetical protein
MSARTHYYIYGIVISLIALGIGLVTRWQFEFHWTIVSSLLLVVVIVLIRSNRYQRDWPMKRLPANEAGATLVRSALAGQGGYPDERQRVPPDNRFKWITQPMIVSLLAIIAIALVF